MNQPDLVKMADFSDNEFNKMIDMCEQVLERSYCVYSKFAVAAVLVTDCGKAISGR